MEFGMFHEFPTLDGRSHAEAFDEAFEQVDEAERSGLDAMWLGELHFAPDRSLLASPLTIATAIAARTRRIRIGIAVQVLPLGHPLRLAEEAATVDQVSRGRLIFGVGRSGVVRTYEAFGVPYGESRDRFVETLEIIRQAWAQPSVSYRGTYFRFEDVTVVPQPYQRPHPPIRMAANTPDTFPLIGRLGLPLLASARHVAWAEMGPMIRTYREAYAAAGHPGKGAVYVSAPAFVAETEARACAEAEPSIMAFYRYQAKLLADSAARSDSVGVARAGRAERLRTMTFEQARVRHALVGTPDGVSAQLRALQDELGLDGIIAELNCGGLIPHPRVLNALRLLCGEVMPRFSSH
jgi:alkanesulfonate monooxygenase SsuD/methylene tetrahydromethanopterin reductase-like flavin-dependent oxidoreductase (luciferase family)